MNVGNAGARTAPLYEEVHVLLIGWAKENDDRTTTITDQLSELEFILESIYHFNVHPFQIPSVKAYRSLDNKISRFIEENDKPYNLLIVYYGGYAEINRDRDCVWSRYV